MGCFTVTFHVELAADAAEKLAEPRNTENMTRLYHPDTIDDGDVVEPVKRHARTAENPGSRYPLLEIRHSY